LTKDTVVAHIKQTHGDYLNRFGQCGLPRIPCNLCDMHYNHPILLELHYIRLHPEEWEKMHYCRICTGKKNRIDSLRRMLDHEHRLHGGPNYFDDMGYVPGRVIRCDVCDKLEFDAKKYREHLTLFHPSHCMTDPQVCRLCLPEDLKGERKFTVCHDVKTLVNHIKTKHWRVVKDAIDKKKKKIVMTSSDAVTSSESLSPPLPATAITESSLCPFCPSADQVKLETGYDKWLHMASVHGKKYQTPFKFEPLPDPIVADLNQPVAEKEVWSAKAAEKGRTTFFVDDATDEEGLPLDMQGLRIRCNCHLAGDLSDVGRARNHVAIAHAFSVGRLGSFAVEKRPDENFVRVVTSVCSLCDVKYLTEFSLACHVTAEHPQLVASITPTEISCISMEVDDEDDEDDDDVSPAHSLCEVDPSSMVAVDLESEETDEKVDEQTKVDPLMRKTSIDDSDDQKDPLMKNTTSIDDSDEVEQHTKAYTNSELDDEASKSDQDSKLPRVLNIRKRSVSERTSSEECSEQTLNRKISKSDY